MERILSALLHARRQITQDGELGSVLRSGGLVLFIRVFGAGASYLSVIALARWLGTSEFGIYSFAWGWTLLLAFPAGLGLPSVSLRFIPEYLATDAWSRIRGLVRGSWRTVGAAGLFLACVGVGVIFLLDTYVAPYYVAPLTAALFGIPLVALITLNTSTARSFGWVGLAFAPSLLSAPLLLLAIAYLIYRSDTAMTAINIVFATLAANAVALIAQRIIIIRRLASRLRAVPDEFEIPRWRRVAFPMLLVNGFVILLLQTDVIMVGLFLPPDQVGIYSAAARTAFLMTFLPQAASALATPKYARLHAQKKHAELQSLLSSLIHWVFWPSILLVVIVIIFGTQILSLFGAEFQVAYWPLVILVIGQMLSTAAGPVAQLLNMTGHQDISAKVLGLSAGLNIVLNATFIPLWGLVGAAAATGLATAASSGWLLIEVTRKLGYRPTFLWREPRRAD